MQRMRVRSDKLRAGEEFLCPIVVKPALPPLEARDYRVPGGGVMFRCMLTGRIIAAANVTALGASAKMQPPPTLSQTFDATGSAWRGHRVDAIPLGLHKLLSDSQFLTRCCRYAPDAVAGVIRDQQRALAIHRQADGPPARFVAIDEKARNDIFSRSRGPAIFEWYINNLVAIQNGAVPAAVFADEGAAAVMRWQIRPV